MRGCNQWPWKECGPIARMARRGEANVALENDNNCQRKNSYREPISGRMGKIRDFGEIEV